MVNFYKKSIAALFLLAGITANAQFPAPYCDVTFEYDIEPITLVEFAGINNPTSATVDGTPALEDFTAIVGSVDAGGTYPITVNGNTGGNWTNYFRVYVDWNQDADFDDAGESYDLGTIVNNPGTGTPLVGSITVPVTALGGTTRMRVWKKYAAYPTTACESPSGFGQAEDYTLTVTAASDCTGAPTVGTASASATDICAGVELNLSVDVTPAPGLSFQWEVSTDGGDTWNPLGAAQDTPDYTVTSQSATSSYRVVVTCTASGMSTTSNMVDVAQNAAVDCYCMPTYDYNCTDGDLLLNVTFLSVNNDSGCGAEGGYTSYIGSIAAPTVDAGSSFPLTVSVGPSGDGWLYESVGVWVDHNKNGVFEEVEYTYIGTGLNQTLTADVTIPEDALDGETRLRVVVSATTAAAFNASYGCGPTSASENYGEMEDYSIIISNSMATANFKNGGFSLYPNPTNGTVNLSFASMTELKSVSVINISGQTVFTQDWNSSADSYEMDVQSLAAGVYIVKVNTDKGIFNQRLIKQ